MLGADLRCLPSPLGDQLHAAFKTPEAAISGEKVHLSSLDIFLRVSTSQILDDTGAPAGSVMLLEDVTGPVTRAARDRRRQRLDGLAQIVGRIAHNVRTPLTAIQTYAQLMAGSDASDGCADFWHTTVNPELERLQRFIKELLLVVEQTEPDLAIVQLTDIVEQAIEQVTSPEYGQGVEPDLQVNEPVPRIVADPQPTRDAFVYLLRYLCAGNATPVRVVVGQNGSVPASASVTFSGSGNARDPELERIIDPLFALEQPDADLGPAISRQILSKQGGNLRAAAENGRIEFHVEFPIAASDRLPAEGKK
jgi:nitrogen-specific signal transduction histidine kinase